MRYDNAGLDSRFQPLTREDRERARPAVGTNVIQGMDSALLLDIAS